MSSSFLSLLPPFIILIWAFFSKKLNQSLLIGFLAAILIASNLSPYRSLQLGTQRIIAQLSEIDYLYLYGFLFIIGMLITLLSASGGARSFARTVKNKMHSKKEAESLSLYMSSLLFIDDYLSNLTVGYIMRPLTDSFRIPRTKLAFLVHSFSGPVVILAPISSWVAMLTSQLESSGIGLADNPQAQILADPFFVYLHSIPFIFYSLLTIMSVWFIVRMNISFGPMYRDEYIAQTTGNLFGGKKPLHEIVSIQANTKGTLLDLIVPIIILLTSVFFGLAYMGGYSLFGGTHTLLESFKNNHKNTFLVLLISVVISLIAATIFAIVRKTIIPQQLPKIFKDGILLMYPAVLMVFLAALLATVLKEDLLVGHYLAYLLHGMLSIWILPCVFFIVATIVATITGSSWATIALLLPISIQMILTLMDAQTVLLPENIAILYPSIGALFSGAVCGDHISPLSETTIMASTSSGCYPLDHCYTNFCYMLPTIISTAIAFLISGHLAHYNMLANIGISLGSAIICCFAMLLMLNMLQKPKITCIKN